MTEFARLPPETLEFVLIFFREVLPFAQPHFDIVMLLAILLVLFVGFVTRLASRLLFAR